MAARKRVDATPEMQMPLFVDGRWIGFSGIGTYLVNLLPLIRSRFSGRIVVLGKQESARELSERCGMEYLEFQARGFSLKEQYLYHRLLRGPATLWVPTISIPLIPISGVRMITTIHDVVHMAMSSGLRRLLYGFYYRRALALSETVITDSDFSRQEISKYFNGYESKVRVISLGFNRPVEQMHKSELSSRWQARRPYILSVGNIKPHKNLHRLKKAFEQIADRLPHALYIIGRADGFISGGKGEHLVGNDRIHFTGYLSDEEVAAAYSFADLFVFPSLYEGFGLPPLEAMSYGIPVVASSAASIPEVCGDAALFCNPLDENSIAAAMYELLTIPELRSEYIKRGKDRVQRINWEETADETATVLFGRERS